MNGIIIIRKANFGHVLYRYTYSVDSEITYLHAHSTSFEEHTLRAVFVSTHEALIFVRIYFCSQRQNFEPPDSQSQQNKEIVGNTEALLPKLLSAGER